MRLLLTSLLVVLSACATTQAVVAAPVPEPVVEPKPVEVKPDPAAQRAQLEAMFARESEPAGTQTFTIGSVEVSTESSTPIVAKHDAAQKSTMIAVGVGASSSMVCYLFDGPVDVGTVVSRTLDGVKTAVTITGMRPSSIEVIEKSPAVFIEARYQTKGTESVKIGQLNMMSYASNVAPMLCIFDEPGYVKAFHRVASSLATALAKALVKPTESFVYRSVDLTRVGAIEIGFSVTMWSKGGDGLMRLISMSTMLMPRSATDWLINDNGSVATLDKDMTIKEKAFFSSNNGEPDLQITLKKDKGGAYTYDGTMQGKPLTGKLKTKNGKGLASDITSARDTREQLLTGKKTKLVEEDYVPSADPTALTTITATKGAGPKQLTLEMGPVKIDAEVDAQGMTETITMQAGPAEMKQKRVFAEGKVP